MKKKSILLICVMMLFVQTIFAQVLIQGTVRSSTSELLPGVNVSVKGTSKGTVTNANGQYSIVAPTDGILLFSFIGYEKSEISLNGRNKVDVVLKNAIEQIDEVVVTALGIKREDVGPGHWVYFYDHDIPFFRISFPSKFSPGNAPAGFGSISCEIAYSRHKPIDEENLVGRTIDALRATGILKESDEIIVEDVMDIPYAYVIYDFNRNESLEIIHTWMKSVGLYPCGRFGEWGYHWSFEAIESGLTVAAQVKKDLGI